MLALDRVAAFVRAVGLVAAAVRFLLRSVKRNAQMVATGIALAGGLLLFLVGSGASQERSGHCRSREVAVVYEEPSELDAACRAIDEVVAYFRYFGFDTSAKVSLQFANRATEGYTGHGTAHGYFDPLRSQIVIYRASDAKPWRQPWSSKLVDSFMRHEIVHLAVWEVLKGDPKRLRREWHEFIAYAIQLDLMDPDLRQEVIAAHADVAPVKELAEINEFSYGMNPDGFAVLAFKTYLDRGGAVFVRQLLNGEIIPPAFSYPFAVQPHEVQR